jgi:hypothetical protein
MFGQYAGDGDVWSDIIAIVINNMKITDVEMLEHPSGISVDEYQS